MIIKASIINMLVIRQFKEIYKEIIILHINKFSFHKIFIDNNITDKPIIDNTIHPNTIHINILYVM